MRWTNKIFCKKILFANQREALVSKDAQDRVRYPLSATILIYKYITNCTNQTRSVSSKGRARPRSLSTLRDYIDLQVIANYANQCHVLYYHTARNIILIIEKHAKTISLSVFFGLPERARTADLGSRSPVCYPTAPQVVKVRSSHRQ